MNFKILLSLKRQLQFILNVLDTHNNKQVNQRKILNKFIDRPVKFLIKHNISPNQLSFLGFICSLIFTVLLTFNMLHFSLWWGWIVPFFLFCAGAFDVFDGEVARRTERNTKAGAFLDSNLDRVSDGLIVIGMILGNLINYITGFILIFLFMMISYIRTRAENEGVEMVGIGLMERAERMILLFFALIVEIWVHYFTIIFFGHPSPLFFQIFIIVFILLLIMTVLQRFFYSYKNLKHLDQMTQRIN
jgi:archaetidylinositol phosphate synthase